MRIFLNWLGLSLLLFSCASYKQSVLIRPTETNTPEKWREEASKAEQNYVIQPNDLLRLEVNSNKGERLIDPNPELTNSNQALNQQQGRQPIDYLVDSGGKVKFPMIGELKLEGLSLRQAEEVAQKEYEKFFKEPFVQLTFINKRVVVLGATGGSVVPLTNQNVKLAEVLALAKGIPQDAKAQAIRVVRGEKVYQVDLSTISGFQQGNMVMEPNDIVYIEPVIRPFSQGLRDYSPVFTLIVSLTTLIAVIYSLQ